MDAQGICDEPSLPLPRPPPIEVTQARYFSALLAEMDRLLKPELTSEPAKFGYEALRRVFVRLIELNGAVPPAGELGAARGIGPEASLPLAELRRPAWREGALLDEIERRIDRRTASYATPIGGGQPITREAVEAYLQSRLGAGALVTGFRILAGGRSKQTILLDLEGAPELPRALVIRRDLPAGPVGTTVVHEFELLRALHALGAPVPQPYLLETGDALGAPLMLMQRVPGALQGDVMAPPSSSEAILDAARVLGRLHAIPAGGLEPTLPSHRRSRPASGLRVEIEGLRDAWNAQARDVSATLILAFDWLLAHADTIAPGRCLVHGDYSFHNILYEGERVTAVLDWELGHIGNPEEDLGYIRSALDPAMWPGFLAAYGGAGGPAADATAVTFFAMLGSLRIMGLLHRARFAVESGVTDDVQLIDVVLFHLPKLIQKLSVTLREVLPAG